MSRILALSDTPDPDRHDGAGRKNSAWVGNGPLDASGRNCGLGKPRNNEAKESGEDRPVIPELFEFVAQPRATRSRECA
jgi:hypothetical protein